ncbi:DUF4349 domain-containing protein [Microbacterium terricola]|uniref:DUF4349 domain-containing protein n=1 Tax=Microbacterium terricola TaxID=344163 RepID=A0ABM8DZ14_9MICO|nr:DUF4349 domain-containing protein [Microbacterium terricola]UYK41330.1 DUF4349 domain-containing protein [Microbacterium terricola]BDV30887.1 hypothetical protein Microterr_15470 [Microbacterium terricola]
MSPDTPDEGTQNADLPELSDRRMAEIESELFHRIGQERRTAGKRRGRIWLGAGAAAAVIVVAAVLAPSMPYLVGSGGAASSDAEIAPDAPADSGYTASDAAGSSAGALEDSGDVASDSGRDEAAGSATGEREIIANASATVVTDDVTAATKDIADEAADRGGYVESMSIGDSGGQPIDVYEGKDVSTYPSPDGAWITVRVPADELTAMLGWLSSIGEVTGSTIDRYDVTSQTVDLEARIDAAQASVDRLTELMGEAGDLSDLIAAESALAERQATLESYQQELKLLRDQVAMSSLTVTLTSEQEAVEADPAGFTDGLIAGWNGLVATLNGIVIALGFLLPWLVVIAVALFAVWAIRRLIRRRRAAASARPPVEPKE